MKVVIKLGSSSLATESGKLDRRALARLADQIVELIEAGNQPILVTSGAVAAGVGALGLLDKPTSPQEWPALAAVGQGELMARYIRLFDDRGVTAGQILLTADNFGNRRSYESAKATFGRLLDWGVVPIVNENDTVATQDEVRFGGNDRLAALVAAMIGADLLLLLTDTEGVYSADPNIDSAAVLIQQITMIDSQIRRAAGAGGSQFGMGGMAAKIDAARIAAWSSIPCVIAKAASPKVIIRAVAGDPVGTSVQPRPRALTARQAWIAFAHTSPPKGAVIINQGALTAIRATRANLLPVGITKVEGEFLRGDLIEIQHDFQLVGKGLAAASADRIRSMLGKGRRELQAELGSGAQGPLSNAAVREADLAVLVD